MHVRSSFTGASRRRPRPSGSIHASTLASCESKKRYQVRRGSCRPAWNRKAVPTGGTKTSEVGRLWFRLLQPCKAVRGVSVRDGVRKDAGRAESSERAPRQRDAPRSSWPKLAQANSYADFPWSKQRELRWALREHSHRMVMRARILRRNRA